MPIVRSWRPGGANRASGRTGFGDNEDIVILNMKAGTQILGYLGLRVTSWKVIQVALGIILPLVAAWMILDPNRRLVLGLAAVFLCGVLVANNCPSITLSLLVLSTLTAENLLLSIMQLPPMVDVGKFNIHLHDPIVFGIAVVICVRLLTQRPLVTVILVRQFLTLTALFLWTGMEILRGISAYGINALGEARTYYAPLLLVPYLALVLNTRERRARALKVAVGLSLGLMLVSVVRAVFASEITMNVRIVSASGALGVMYGLIGLQVLRNRKLLDLPRWFLVPIYLAGAFLLIFTAHRSVWLALLITMVVLILMREVRLRHAAGFVVTGIMSSILAAAVLHYVGHDPKTFVIDRAEAYVDPEGDPSFRWRLYMWEEALLEVRKQPVAGIGLGRHFALAGPSMEIIHTSPHNLPVTILFQMGIVGLFLYLVFGGRLALRLYRSWRRSVAEDFDTATVTCALIILISAHGYYVAYVLDWMTWIYVGLGGAVLLHSGQLGAQYGNNTGTLA